MDSQTQKTGLVWLTAVVTALGAGAGPGALAASLAPDTTIEATGERAHSTASIAAAQPPGLGRGMALRHTPGTVGLHLHPAWASSTDATAAQHLRGGVFKVAFADPRGPDRPAALPPRGDTLRLDADCVAVDAHGACQRETPPQARAAAQSHARTAAANGIALLSLIALWQRLARR
ncbi:MAG: hypothetical protein FHP92_12410 [Denitromonas halophila]|nr:MAG: hypothetical protein FHP92_12410 [Denitromonas halophila]